MMIIQKNWKMTRLDFIKKYHGRFYDEDAEDCILKAMKKFGKQCFKAAMNMCLTDEQKDDVIKRLWKSYKKEI